VRSVDPEEHFVLVGRVEVVVCLTLATYALVGDEKVAARRQAHEDVIIQELERDDVLQAELQHMLVAESLLV
jgi:hypothetical protein